MFVFPADTVARAIVIERNNADQFGVKAIGSAPLPQPERSAAPLDDHTRRFLKVDRKSRHCKKLSQLSAADLRAGGLLLPMYINTDTSVVGNAAFVFDLVGAQTHNKHFDALVD